MFSLCRYFTKQITWITSFDLVRKMFFLCPVAGGESEAMDGWMDGQTVGKREVQTHS